MAKEMSEFIKMLSKSLSLQNQKLFKDLITRSMAFELAVQQGLITREQVASLVVNAHKSIEEHNGDLAAANNELAEKARELSKKSI